MKESDRREEATRSQDHLEMGILGKSDERCFNNNNNNNTSNNNKND